MINSGKTIKDAARIVNIPYENAKAIFRVFRQEMRTSKHTNRQRFKIKDNFYTAGPATADQFLLQSPVTASNILPLAQPYLKVDSSLAFQHQSIFESSPAIIEGQPLGIRPHHSNQLPTVTRMRQEDIQKPV